MNKEIRSITLVPEPIYIILPHKHYNSDKLEKVIAEMRELGVPTIKAVHLDGNLWVALEGSHRLRAAYKLGLFPNFEEIDLDDCADKMIIEDLGLDFQDEMPLHELVARIQDGFPDLLEFGGDDDEEKIELTVEDERNITLENFDRDVEAINCRLSHYRSLLLKNYLSLNDKTFLDMEITGGLRKVNTTIGIMQDKLASRNKVEGKVERKVERKKKSPSMGM